MKKYLGNYMTIFSVFFLLFFMIIPTPFAIWALSYEISFPSIFLTLMMILSTIVLTKYFIKVSNQLITFAHFTKEKIVIKNALSKKVLYEMKYKQCADIGIGSYLHTVKKVYFVYIPYNWLTPEERDHINYCYPSETFIKMGYSKKNYDFLMSVLPQKQANRLLKSHESFLLSKQKGKKQS